jgi:tetratricopeptide (TPR) repeat protein
MKKNLEHSALPGPDEIRDYQEGKLDAARSHEIEMIAQENPLLADAIEGYSGNAAYHLLPGITAAVAAAAGTTTAAAAATATVAGAVKAATPWWHLNGWLIGATVGTTAAVGTYYVQETLQQDKPKESPKTEQAYSGVSDVEQNEKTAQLTMAGEELTSEQQAADVAPMQEEGSAKTNNAADQSLTSGVEPKNNAAEHIPSIGNGAVLRSATNPSESSPKTSSTVAINIMKVLNYKMADYTAIRDGAWEKFSASETGLPARWETEADRQKFKEEHPDRLVPYVDYITTCISAFDNGRYQMAIERFGVVLNQYPDDVNAQFYIAMSHFHLGNWDAAIAMFSRTEKNVIRTFNEESYFYHAKSLKAIGDVDAANSLFVKVVKMNGFYKELAIDEMQ